LWDPSDSLFSDERIVQSGLPVPHNVLEAETCLTMRDIEDNPVKLCHNSDLRERWRRGQGAEVARETIVSVTMVHDADLQEL
jgi:hypothetical protein